MHVVERVVQRDTVLDVEAVVQQAVLNAPDQEQLPAGRKASELAWHEDDHRIALVLVEDGAAELHE
eukprot:3226845-Alexandrium_andersonii.AAC.1